MHRLDGKMALVTGGSRGIGRAIALALAKAGAHVIVHYGRSQAEASAVVTEIVSSGGRADAVGADLASEHGAFHLAERVRSIVGDRLDILVANAGISKAGSMDEHTVREFDNLFATNVRAPFFLLQQLLPVMHAGSNAVVVTSLVARVSPSSPGHIDGAFLPAYAATKGALEALVKHWASMLGPQGIRVNAVAPGIIKTEMSNFTKSEARLALTLDMQALKRIGTAEDVADVVVFIASDGARWITGASIPVDGGSKL